LVKIRIKVCGLFFFGGGGAPCTQDRHMDMDMDGKIHIHGNPAKVTASSRLVGTTKALTTVNNV